MRVSRSISLEHLGEHLSLAKERLSAEKKEILKNYLLPGDYSREEYMFAYLRAEREGMQAIQACLAEISWLPMQLDLNSELVTEHRASIKRWLAAASGGAHPTADDFGNDFIHALTRSSLLYGAADATGKKLMQRIVRLFRDLSCLIGVIYYATWLAERDVEGILLSDPADLHRSVVEMVAIVQSPDLKKALKLRAEAIREARAKAALEKPAALPRNFLHLIRNDDFSEHAAPDPLPV